MSDVLVIVSAALFDRARDAAGKKLRKGSVWPTDAYVSTNKAIANKLTGDLWLVTVREESLWLVAVLQRPRHDGRAWTAAANAVPVVDITELAGQLEFDSGTGVNVERMAMSLQTPRGLTAGDVAKLKAAAAGGRSAAIGEAELEAVVVKITAAVLGRTEAEVRADRKAAFKALEKAMKAGIDPDPRPEPAADPKYRELALRYRIPVELSDEEAAALDVD